MPKSSKSGKKGSAKSKGGGSRTVTATVPKSLSSSIDRIRTKLDTVDSTLREHIKNFNNQAKAWSKQMSEARSGGRAQRAKRKPSEYNLFLKDKMKQGMTMTEAVQSWKARGGGSSSSSSMSGSSMSSSMGGEESESGAEEEES